MNRWTLSAATAALSLTLLAAPSAAQTNGFVMQCMSARTAGAGCVTRAQEATPTNLFRDPASLVDFEAASFEVNLSSFTPSLTFENAANPFQVAGTQHTYPMFSAAYIARPSGNFAWGIGLEPIGGFGADFALQHDLLSGPNGTAVDYETFFMAMKAGPAVAWRFAEGWSVGASASVIYSQIRDFRMPFTMPATTPLGMGAIAQLDGAVYGPMFSHFTELTAYGDSESYAGFGWTADLGLRYTADNGFVFAASWAPERPITLDGGTATIDMTAQFQQMLGGMVMARAQAYQESPQQAQGAVMQQLGMAGLDLQAGVVSQYDAATELTLPMTFGAGIRTPLTEGLRMSAEVEWRQWSNAQSVMPFRLTNGTNANINLMMNADPTNSDFTYPFPLEWQDSWTAKVGAEYALSETLALRGGFLYGENPVPDHTVFIAFPAISTNAATFGLTFDAAGVPLDVSYVRALQTDFDGCGENHLIGAEYLNSRSGMSQDVITLGTRLSF